MKPGIVVLSVVVLALGLAPSSTANECIARTLCERVNGDVDVFTAKVLTEMDDDGTVGVHVVRSFKGSAKGDIRVIVFPTGELGSPEYEIGKSYLFYAWKEKENGVVKRRNGGCGGAPKLEDVTRDELTFLEHLGSGSQTGEVFGRAVKSSSFEDPIRNLRIILKAGNREYSSKTDHDGTFRITGIPPGIYNLHSEGLPDDLLLQGDREIELSPHGCFEAFVLASHNATISGRVTLPPGFEVEGTAIHAFSSDGREASEAFADRDGRYLIVGIASGEYVIGVNAGRFPPSVAAPFPPTYAPAAADRERASKVHIETGSHVEDVDIWVSAPSQTATIQVNAKFDDGTPLTEGSFGLSVTGAGQFGGGHTDSAGSAVLEIVRGVRAFLIGGAMTERGIPKCMAPLVVGPDAYPEILEATLSEEGCRQQSNLSTISSLRASHTGALEPLLVVAQHPSGAVAYRAEVFVSQRPNFFTGGFQTDSRGRVEVPAPSDGELTLRGSVLPIFVFPNPPANCRSHDITVTREHGSRWRFTADPSTWHEASEPIVLHLSGPDCVQ